MGTNYYLPISSECLAHYFGIACILPSKYLPNKPKDIQNKFEEFLLITSNYGSKDTDCCIELVFTKHELKELITLRDGYYLYGKPLPITRVKEILFTDNNQRQQTITNITLSTAFIPERLVKVIDKFDENKISDLEKSIDTQSKDWSAQVKKYNSLLGGFALLRHAGEEYMNYSENYFSSLATYSSIIGNELLIAGKRLKNLFNDPIYKRVLEFIQKEIDEDALNQIAGEENQSIQKDKYTKIINLENLKDATLIVAVLNTFGVGEEAKKKKIDGLILSNFKSEIQPDRSEIIALCYGLNRGYSLFSNKYKSENVEKIVKFELNTQLDYYTIESLYQYSFNNLLKNEEFPYLDNWCPMLKTNSLDINKYDYQILDVKVISKKKAKVSSGEYLGNLLRQYFQKEAESYFRDFTEKIRSTVLNDLSEEFKEEISSKDQEIKRLKTEQKKVLILESEINRLQNENSNLINSIRAKEDSVKSGSEVGDGGGEPPITIENTNDKVLIANEIFNYYNMNFSELKKLAEKKNINTTGLKKEDTETLIIKLISIKDNTLFDKQ